MEIWEKKWKEFKDGKNVEEARFVSSNNLKYTEEDLKALFEFLPDTLYHATTGGAWKRIKQVGYLGFEYTNKKAMSARRGYQPITTGVFLGTSPNFCIEVGGKTFRDYYRKEGIVVLSLSKSILDPSKITIDLDSVDVTLGLDKTDRKTFDLSKVLRKSKGYDLAIFYEGVIPLEKISVEQDNTKQAEKASNALESKAAKVIQTLESRGIEFEESSKKVRGHKITFTSNPLSQDQAKIFGVGTNSRLEVGINLSNDVVYVWATKIVDYDRFEELTGKIVKEC